MGKSEKNKLRETALNEHEKALEAYTKALEIYRSTGDRSNEASVLIKIAELHRAKASTILLIDDPPKENDNPQVKTVASLIDDPGVDTHN